MAAFGMGMWSSLQFSACGLSRAHRPPALRQIPVPPCRPLHRQRIRPSHSPHSRRHPTTTVPTSAWLFGFHFPLGTRGTGFFTRLSCLRSASGRCCGPFHHHHDGLVGAFLSSRHYSLASAAP
ncbi:hypothetical protein QBC39DRAFT_164575 [Podospora conica]|nr:hypothetical protein QBC39DRAFT_164575 [Schizothecium conicum]